MWSNSPLFCEKSSNSVECLASSYLWPISMLNPVFRKQKSTYPPKNNIKNRAHCGISFMFRIPITLLPTVLKFSNNDNTEL